jgi:hypothetical protein
MWKEKKYFEALLTNTKRQEVFWLFDFAFRVEKPRWFKFLWLVPQVWIHMDSMEQRYNLCILWNFKAVEVHISAKETHQ